MVFMTAFTGFILALVFHFIINRLNTKQRFQIVPIVQYSVNGPKTRWSLIPIFTRKLCSAIKLAFGS